MTSQVLIRTIIEVQHELGDERIVRLVEAVSSIYPRVVAGAHQSELSRTRANTGATTFTASTLVPAKVAAAHVRSRARPARHVHPQTVRRYIRNCGLLAVNAPKEQLVPLGQLDVRGLPPARLQEVLNALHPVDRHNPATVEWFMRERPGTEGETPIQLLHRGRAHDVRLVRRAAAQLWLAARGARP